MFLKKVGLFHIFTTLLIILFLTFFILYETANNARTFIILLSVVGFSSLTILVLKYREVYFPLPTSFFIFFFFAWMVISAFFSKDISQTLWEILRTASFFGLFFAVYNLVRKNKFVQSFLLVTFTVVGVVLVAKDLYSFFSWGAIKEGRHFVGSFAWHNQMAGFLVILIPLTCSLFLATRNLYLKIFLFLSILLLIVGIILTQSRGGWLSLFTALLLFALFYFRKIKLGTKPILLLFLVFLVAFLFFQPTGIIDKAKSVSGNLRLTVWQGALKMIKDYPVFGVGPGAFGSSFHQYQQQPWLYARNAHNHYLEYAAEIGIIGFLLFALVILSPIFNLTLYRHSGNQASLEHPESHPHPFPLPLRERARVRGQASMTKKKGLPRQVLKARDTLIIGAVSALFGSGVHAFVDTDWSRVSLYSIFWILMAVILASVVRKEKTFEVVGEKKIIYLVLFLPLVFGLILGISNKSYEMAKKSLEEGKIEEAENNILEAIRFNPFDFSSRVLYGQVLEIQKKPEEAKDIYLKAAFLSVFDSQPPYRIGLIEFQKENYKQAIKWFEKAVKLNPYSHPRLYDAIADTYLELEDKEEARKSLKLAIEKAFPLNESFRGFEYIYDYTGFKKDLGKTYIKLITLDVSLGQKEEAEKLLNVVKKNLDSDNPAIPFLKML